MSGFTPEELNQAFADLTQGLDLNWGTQPTASGLQLPDWSPRDGAKMRLIPQVGNALRAALYDELRMVEADMTTSLLTDPQSVNSAYASALSLSMQKGSMPMSPGEGMAVRGAAIVFAGDADEGYFPHLLPSKKTLFGTVAGPGYGRHIDATPEAIAAYQEGVIEEIEPIFRTDLLLVLANACLCTDEGYGPVEWEAEVVMVPLANDTIRLFGTVQLP